MANPNPQSHQPKFKGPREIANSSTRSGFSVDPVDLLRFGKRVNFGNKLTTNEVLEDHLRVIKHHKQQNRYEKDNKLLKEKEEIRRLEQELESVEKQKMRHSEVLKNEFMFFNDQKKLDNKLRRELEQKTKKAEDLNYFPFTSGELIEAHRQTLENVMRDDLKSFIQMKS
jgi:hypothetical protein